MSRNITAWLGFLADRSATPFAWGRDGHDCVSFALGSVKALTGGDLAGRLPRWSSEATAKRALARLGGLEAATNGVLRPIAPVALAQRGDIAGVIQPSGDLALMVVEGHALVGPHPVAGLRRLPRTAMSLAWSAE